MKFETNKKYVINKPGNDYIHVVRRTPCYITFISSIDGAIYKRRIYKNILFDGNEYILTPCGVSAPGQNCFCVSDTLAEV